MGKIDALINFQKIEQGGDAGKIAEKIKDIAK